MVHFVKKRRKLNKSLIHKKDSKKPKIIENEEIKSSDEDISEIPEIDKSNTSEQYKRKIQARKQLSEYLTAEGGCTAESNARDLVNDKLLSSVMSQLKRSRRLVADNFKLNKPLQSKLPSCFSINCLSLFPCGHFAVMGTRSCCLIKWNIDTNTSIRVLRRRNCQFLRSEVLCVAVHGAHVGIGCRDGTVSLLDLELNTLGQFRHRHKDAVTGVTFGNIDSLYSCSGDKTVKCWSISGLCYLSTLYGHLEGITDIDVFGSAEKVITAGGGESQVRLWKIMDDKQLVFSTSASEYIDCVAVLDDEHFITGGTKSSLQLWVTSSAKPVFYLNHAHNGEWITSVEAVRNSDLFGSGGSDGFVRFWKIGEDIKCFTPLFAVEVGCGFINRIVFSPFFDRVVVIVARQHRLGSWWKLESVDNMICTIDVV